MTLVVTVYVPEGLVMASDSRMSLWVPQRSTSTLVPTVETFTHIVTDSVYKTYQIGGRVGVSIFGDAGLPTGEPLTGFMQEFVRRHERDTGAIETLARKLTHELRQSAQAYYTGFHMAGYDVIGGQESQVVYRLPLSRSPADRGNTLEVANDPKEQVQVVWDGESDVMTRLMKPVTLAVPTRPTDDDAEADGDADTNGRPDTDGTADAVNLPHFNVSFSWFSLQDAIDFAIYAIRVTADTMRFQVRRSTVGGPIDVLVIRPEGAQWLQRKELTVRP